MNGRTNFTTLSSKPKSKPTPTTKVHTVTMPNGSKAAGFIVPAAATDMTLTRAIEQAVACRAAHLDDWEAGWVAGTLQATGADDLPIDLWRECVGMLIANVVDEEETLIDDGLDSDDPEMLAEYVKKTRMVIQ
jgi:hypothetical protein